MAQVISRDAKSGRARARAYTNDRARERSFNIHIDARQPAATVGRVAQLVLRSCKSNQCQCAQFQIDFEDAVDKLS
jgi:hypothetical protein